MEANKKMWALLVPLSKNWEVTQCGPMFDDSVWEEMVRAASENGINTIVFDLLDGICYGSHPEIVLEKAWSRERLGYEIKRLKSLGIQAIPKLNFSATHDGWLKEYERLLSTPAYYRVCRDLIMEVGELFEQPRYIHLGMDEEDAMHAKCSQLAVYRHKELLWHDLQYLCDCVRDAGSTPWIWSCPCFSHPEEFRARMKTDSIVLSPWMYNAILKEHWTPIKTRQAYIDYYAKEPFASMNIQYVEEDPFIVDFMQKALPCVEDGYKVIPCVSSINQCRYNAADTLEYFKENANADRVLGYITSPWLPVVESNKDRILNEIRWFGQAIQEVYHGIKIDENEKVNIEYDGIAVDNVY